MFCANCSKPIAENSRFCSHCGKPVSQAIPSAVPVLQEWEYTYYRRSWESGKGGKFPLTFGRTEYSVRLDNWGSHQSWILPDIQNYLDKGWTPLSEVGPGAYRFIYNDNYLELNHFLVEMRRPATSFSNTQKLLVGVWQEVNDPNKGVLNTLGNLLSGKLSAQRERIEFSKDRTFRWIDWYDKSREGVYVEQTDGFLLMCKVWQDVTATVTDDKLICKPKHAYNKEYERIERIS